MERKDVLSNAAALDGFALLKNRIDRVVGCGAECVVTLPVALLMSWWQQGRLWTGAFGLVGLKLVEGSNDYSLTRTLIAARCFYAGKLRLLD